MKTWTLLPLAALVASHAFAQTVDVTTRPARAHVDAGLTGWEQQDNLGVLARHLQKLGREMLPAGQTLQVELLDVDLAGTQLGSGPRIVHGGADWPRIHLRYTLHVPGQAPRSGDEVVQDMNYLRGMAGAPRMDPLHYEKRMLKAWFKERFASPSPA